MKKVRDEDIEAALTSLSRIIKRYGDVYWPLFERLELELQNRRSRAARMRRFNKPSVSQIQELRTITMAVEKETTRNV